MKNLKVNGVTRGQYRQNCPKSWGKCTLEDNPEYHLDYKIKRAVDLGKVTYTYSNGCSIVRYFNNNFLVDDEEIMTMWVDDSRDMYYVSDAEKRSYDKKFLNKS